MKFIVGLALLGLAVLAIDGRRRNELRETARDLSDHLVSGFLARLSQFEDELTHEGHREQQLWRQQRLHDLHLPDRKRRA